MVLYKVFPKTITELILQPLAAQKIRSSVSGLIVQIYNSNRNDHIYQPDGSKSGKKASRNLIMNNFLFVQTFLQFHIKLAWASKNRGLEILGWDGPPIPAKDLSADVRRSLIHSMQQGRIIMRPSQSHE